MSDDALQTLLILATWGSAFIFRDAPCHDELPKRCENKHGLGGFMSQVIKIFTVLSLAFSTAAVQASEKEWTIMVFLNADNNLESFGFMDMQEMEKVGSTKDVNVVVQFDPISPRGSQRVLVEKSTKPYSKTNEYHSTVLEEMPEQDMGDYKTFVDFVVWGMRSFPAKKYAVVFWNHGSGWSKDAPLSAKSISYDDTSMTHMTTGQIAQSMAEIQALTARRVDVVAFDACLMAMFEIADSVSEYSDFFVASEANIPGKGFAYDDLLEDFNSRADKSARQLSLDMVGTYKEEYSSAFGGVTIGAMELSKLEGVKTAMGEWVGQMQQSREISRDELLNIARDTVAFQDPDYRDLGDYLSRVEAALFSKDEYSVSMIKSTQDLQAAVKAMVISNWASGKFAKSTGLSIHLPYRTRGYSPWSALHIPANKERRDSYMNLEWGSTTAWPEHLDQLFPIQ